MMLANNHLKPIVGVDTHIILTPPFAIPVPLPYPFVGIVMDPMDYIPKIGSTVNVNGLPRGNAGTAGMLTTMVHIPIGGPFMMAPMIGHDSMNFFGSTRVKADGSYLSPAGYMVMTCNDIGMPLSLTPGKKMKPVPSLYLPSSSTLPVPSGPPVMVGGPYAPDLMGLVMGLVMSYGFGALMKLGKNIGGKLLTKLNHSVLKKFKSTQGLSKKLCKLGFEPVDLITGRMLYEGDDFTIPGVIPITWQRSWYSDSDYEGSMGYGFHHNYDLSLTIDTNLNAIAMRLPDGRITAFPLIVSQNDSFYHRSEKLTLTCVDTKTYSVKNHNDNLTYVFTKRQDNTYLLQRIENSIGLANTFTYDASDHLKQITDTAGRTINLQLDTLARITQITATHHSKTRTLVSYTYNDDGNLIAITDALGKATTMVYSNHLMVKKTDRNGQSFYWEYDGKTTGAKCIKTWGDHNILSGTISYGKGKNVITNSLGQQSIYYFDANNLCTQVTDALGNHTFHEYTEFMEPFRDIDADGNSTGYSYDDRGNLTQITTPDLSVTTFMYDDQDRLILSVSPEGKTVSRVYKNDQLSAIIDTDSAVTSFKYNSLGLVGSVSDQHKNTSTLEYDNDFNLTAIKVNNKLSRLWQFDSWGRCIATTNAENHRQSFTYDDLDRILKIQKADRNIIKLAYNAYDEVIETIDSKKRRVNFDYTPMGSLKAREENGALVEFNYNTEEQLLSIKNEHDEWYRFGRNANGDIINETGFDGLRREYIRNRAGKVIRVKRPNERFTEYEYDNNGRITRAEHHDGTWETYTYNKDGDLIEAVNQNSHVQLVRDSGGKIITEIQNGHEVESTYNNAANRIALKSSLGADIAIKRNTLGQVDTLSASVGQDDSDTKTVWSAQYSYNSIGQETERILPGGIHSKTEYDFAGRPLQHTVTKGRKETRQRHYTWNVNDQLQSMVNQLTNGKVSYRYDDFGNLASAQYETGQFDYKLPDEVGNLYRTKGQKDREYGKGGQLLKANNNTFTYDTEGNLTQKITPKGNWHYNWYGNGMLESVIKPDGKKISFEYDALGRRTAKKQTTVSLSGIEHVEKGKITRFVWDGNVPLHEWKYDLKDRPTLAVDDVGMLIESEPEPISNLITWVFDEGSFKPTAKIVDGNTYSIITDYLGTPVEAYNTKGEKVWEVEYDIYGNIRKQTLGQQNFVPFRYQGQYEDEETGLYYNRFRYYSADEGVYVSQDPIGLDGNNPNFYAYTSDNNTYIDPFGLDCEITKLRADAPMNIPKTASVKVQAKNGYKQVKFTWRRGGFKYEARWHTATPNAPSGSGANWRVTRRKPGNGGELPITKQLGQTSGGNNKWIDNSQWYDAQNAYSAGNATQAQKDLLSSGHVDSNIANISLI